MNPWSYPFREVVAGDSKNLHNLVVIENPCDRIERCRRPLGTCPILVKNVDDLTECAPKLHLVEVYRSVSDRQTASLLFRRGLAPLLPGLHLIFLSGRAIRWIIEQKR